MPVNAMSKVVSDGPTPACFSMAAGKPAWNCAQGKAAWQPRDASIMNLTFDEGKLFYELYAAEFVEENPANLLASDLEIVKC